MSVSSTSGGTETQALVYQENYVEFAFEQDCGSYSIEFEPVDATSCDMTALLSVDAKSGTGGVNNHAYSQQMSLTSNDVSDIGQCEMYMVLKSDGFLDKDGATTRYVPDKKYQFTATVEPCTMSLVNSPALSDIDMTYTLGETAISQSYEIN